MDSVWKLTENRDFQFKMKEQKQRRKEKSSDEKSDWEERGTMENEDMQEEVFACVWDCSWLTLVVFISDPRPAGRMN